MTEAEKRQEEEKLLQRIAATLGELDSLLAECSDHWGYEDPIYRFYHQSFKVFGLQETTETIVAKLQALAPAPRDREGVLRGRQPALDHLHPSDRRSFLSCPVLLGDGLQVRQDHRIASRCDAERMGFSPVSVQPSLIDQGESSAS
jgi:hypothetical protein